MPIQLDTVEANAKIQSAFDFEEVQLQFQLESKICKLLVRDNYVYLILKAGNVHIINLEDPEIVKDIKIPISKESELKNAWIDKHRNHLILQSSKNEYYYINHQASTYQNLSKLKNIPITSISFFDDCVTQNYTGPILISTSNSLLLEYAIDSNKETLLKSVMKNKYCINTICNSRISTTNGVIQYSINLFTVDSLIVNIKAKIPSEPSSTVSVFQGISKIEPIIIKQHDISEISSDDKSIGYISTKSGNTELMLVKSNIINESNFKPSSIKLGDLEIKSFLLTNFFILILTENNYLEIYNKLNLQLINSISLSYLDKKMKGISVDELSKTFWLYSDNHLFELIVNFNESGIIPTMVKQNMFDEALKLLSENKSTDTSKKANYILKRKGYYLLGEKRYSEAVEVLAQSDEPFDKISLKLFELEDKTVLRYYLQIKLKKLTNTMKAQKQLLSSWIVEIFIEQLNSQDSKLISTHEKKNIINNNNNNNNNNDNQKEYNSNHLKNGDSTKNDKLHNEFCTFVSENINVFDKETIYQIIISHNRNEDLLFFANKINDFQFVLKHYISLQRWDEALKVLATQQDSELIYKCSTVLLVNYPVKTVDMWIRLTDDLDELKLMSSLLTYNKTVACPQNIMPEHNQALRYLRFLIYENKVSSRMIHNTFFSILITYPDIHNESLILKELERYQSIKRKAFGKHDRETLFDHDFILRLSFKFNRIQSAIYIYSILNKKEEAVILALNNDLINAAILVADKCDDSDEYQRKKLWLKISERLINKVVTNKDYIKQHQKMFFGEHDTTASEDESDPVYVLLKFLTDKCNDLTIKDLLPLFPDFIIIDNFKDSLVDALKKLSLEMNKTSNDMGSILKESDKINDKIKNFKTTNFQIIEPFESCQLCHKILAIRKFIVFPCSHSFHQDCLVKNILESNDYKTKNSIYKLQKKTLMNNKNPAAMEELKLEIDQLLCKSCCLCSNMKINEIDEPLIKSGDRRKNDWDI